jgi:hypothetical protein
MTWCSISARINASHLVKCGHWNRKEDRSCDNTHTGQLSARAPGISQCTPGHHRTRTTARDHRDHRTRTTANHTSHRTTAADRASTPTRHKLQHECRASSAGQCQQRTPDRLMEVGDVAEVQVSPARASRARPSAPSAKHHQPALVCPGVHRACASPDSPDRPAHPSTSPHKGFAHAVNAANAANPANATLGGRHS